MDSFVTLSVCGEGGVGLFSGLLAASKGLVFNAISNSSEKPSPSESPGAAWDPDALTVTSTEPPAEPPRPSETVSATMYVPAAVYACATALPVPLAPSPNCQL